MRRSRLVSDTVVTYLHASDGIMPITPVSGAMSVIAALAAGGAIGARHALETDHLAAIATLVDDEDAERPGLVGASWGVGHSIPIVVLGLGFLALGIELPEAVVVGVEALVGLVLVALGARMLARSADLTTHSHGGDGHDHGHDGDGASHAHGPRQIHTTDDHDSHHHGEGDTHSHDDGVHRHLNVGSLSLGHTHTHIDGEGFAVGMLHGVAGSGALVVLLVSTADSIPGALSFLVGFSAFSIATMALVTFVWGRTLETALRTYLEVGAGLLGVGVGVTLLIEQLPHIL